MRQRLINDYHTFYFLLNFYAVNATRYLISWCSKFKKNTEIDDLENERQSTLHGEQGYKLVIVSCLMQLLHFMTTELCNFMPSFLSSKFLFDRHFHLY